MNARWSGQTPCDWPMIPRRMSAEDVDQAFRNMGKAHQEAVEVDLFECPPLDLIRGRIALAREANFCPSPSMHFNTESEQQAFIHNRRLHEALAAALSDLELVLAEVERHRADDPNADLAVPGEGDQC